MINSNFLREFQKQKLILMETKLENKIILIMIFLIFFCLTKVVFDAARKPSAVLLDFPNLVLVKC